MPQTHLPTIDLYTVLGINSEADQTTIKSAFRDTSLVCHPDKAGNSGEVHEKRHPSTANQPYRASAGTIPKRQSGFKKRTANDIFNDFGGQRAFRLAFNNMKPQWYDASKASPPKKLPVALAYGDLLEQVLAYPLDRIVPKTNGDF
ncbi:hypothetical protein DL769_007831 [Monosporascus sp. CRB-8-3]|nr:hypothetical protein DL769_007831 [Monosporascus sp. CRB-8-3]